MKPKMETRLLSPFHWWGNEVQAACPAQGYFGDKKKKSMLPCFLLKLLWHFLPLCLISISSVQTFWFLGKSWLVISTHSWAPTMCQLLLHKFVIYSKRYTVFQWDCPFLLSWALNSRAGHQGLCTPPRVPVLNRWVKKKWSQQYSQEPRCRNSLNVHQWMRIKKTWYRIGRIKIVKMSILAKAIYRFTAISIKIPIVFFT